MFLGSWFLTLCILLQLWIGFNFVLDSCYVNQVLKLKIKKTVLQKKQKKKRKKENNQVYREPEVAHLFPEFELHIFFKSLKEDTLVATHRTPRRAADPAEVGPSVAVQGQNLVCVIRTPCQSSLPSQTFSSRLLLPLIMDFSG